MIQPTLFDDFERESKYKIYVRRYANGKTIYLHRFVMNAPSHLQVDHINGNGVDNRKTNLRLATPQQNAFNTQKINPNKTGFKGVFKAKGVFRAVIGFNGKNIHLGGFKTVQEAAKAYDAKAKELFGEFAYLNFPEQEDIQLSKMVA